MVLGGVFDDGQAQSGAAGGPGVAFVHPVEPLKHPALLIGGNADAGVCHPKDGVTVLLGHGDIHPSAGDIVLDGVAAQVLKDLPHQTPDTGEGEPVNRAASASKFPTTLCIGKEYRKIVYLLYELSILISMMSLWIRRNQESLRWSNRPSHKE